MLSQTFYLKTCGKNSRNWVKYSRIYIKQTSRVQKKCPLYRDVRFIEYFFLDSLTAKQSNLLLVTLSVLWRCPLYSVSALYRFQCTVFYEIFSSDLFELFSAIVRFWFLEWRVDNWLCVQLICTFYWNLLISRDTKCSIMAKHVSRLIESGSCDSSYFCFNCGKGILWQKMKKC